MIIKNYDINKNGEVREMYKKIITQSELENMDNFINIHFFVFINNIHFRFSDVEMLSINFEIHFCEAYL